VTQAYLLSEDDFDDAVYVYILEVLLARRVDLNPMRLRRGGGLGEVRKKLPLLLSHVRRSGLVDDTCFVIAIDNDRAREHPAHQALAHTRDEPCRHCAMEQAIHEQMPDGWPIPGACAVPVQMIESWLLLLHDPVRYPREADLPVCAWSTQETARRLYGPRPPPQLKDLVEAALHAGGTPAKVDFALACALRLDPEDLATRSPSFDRFRSQVARWSGRQALDAT
jgi:hypothetical protein